MQWRVTESLFVQVGNAQCKEDSTMGEWIKRTLVIFTVVALVFTTTGFSALAQEEMKLDNKAPAESMIADFCVMRPLGIGATVVGTAFFIVSLPFSALGKNTGPAWDKMVADPFAFTFARPLGEVD
jgi:hypothetical protein